MDVNRDESSPSRRISETPISLSYTPGGKDETRALVTQVTDDTRALQLTTYFQDVVNWFEKRPDYRVDLLQLYNATGNHGFAISLLDEHNSQAIAIACLRHKNKYFYFCELLSGGRAAFLYKKDFSELLVADFAVLFAFYKANHLDWLKCKQHLPTSGPGYDFVVHPRNRHNGGVATALRCDQLISKLLTAKRH